MADLTTGMESLSVSSFRKTYGLSDRVYIADVFANWETLMDKQITVGGWVKTGRSAEKGTLYFIELSDASTPKNIQCKRKVDPENAEDVAQYSALSKTGACALFRGKLVKTPEGTAQPFELDIEEVLHNGPIEQGYPIAKARLPLEALRTSKTVHFRPRTNIISAVARVRNALAQATHMFFNQNGFFYLHTPLITSSDCEGAGEMFQVTTLLSKAEEIHKTPMPSDEDIKAAEAAVEEQGKVVSEMKEQKRDKKTVKAGVAELTARKEALAALQQRRAAQGGLPRSSEGPIDYAKDFFGRAAFLTVSGQLQGESYACAMGNIYTFGPTFRAENSNTSRHLAEFWMIEPEIAFCDIIGCMNCAEDYVKFCCKYVLDHCREDLEFFNKHIDKTCLARVQQVADPSDHFVRLAYKDAVAELLQHQKDGHQFVVPVEDRIDLATEHERYLTEVIYKKPVILYNYPKEIKAFYMRQNDDEYDSVAAMDILVPKVGELVGGSQREERLDVLTERLVAMGLNLEDYEWYMDLRRHGTTPHSGFGLGFERLILFVTGMENIRDVIPYPRYPDHIL
eukprot:m.51917 g.51917  ORF g.51917 m.51917 type:complete len:567 (-) comp12658_c4_seq1:83-1783(-)